jgi:hypothetical protein
MQGTYRLSSTEMSSLNEVLDRSDIAVFVLMPQDFENTEILCELSYCAGRIGMDRTFYVVPEMNRENVPSFIGAFRPAVYNPQREAGQAVGRACVEIRERVGNLISQGKIPHRTITAVDLLRLENRTKYLANSLRCWGVVASTTTYTEMLSHFCQAFDPSCSNMNEATGAALYELRNQFQSLQCIGSFGISTPVETVPVDSDLHVAETYRSEEGKLYYKPVRHSILGGHIYILCVKLNETIVATVHLEAREMLNVDDKDITMLRLIEQNSFQFGVLKLLLERRVRHEQTLQTT